MKTANPLLLFSAILISASALAQTEKIDTTMISKIKKEGFDHSKVMEIVSNLTDIHGPRLTNSTGYQNAANYAKSTLESWGLTGVKFDTWDEDFGHGWNLKKFSLQTLGPVYFPVISYPKAWSPGVAKGPVQAEAVYFDVKSEADLAKYTGKLKGKIVLFGAPVAVKPGFKPDASRFNDSTLLVMSNAGPEPAPNFGRFGGNREQQQLTYSKWEFCMKEGAIAVLEPSPSSRLEDGTIIVGSVTVPYPPSAPFEGRVRAQKLPNAVDVKKGAKPDASKVNGPTVLPQIVVADEHYNRLVRQIQAGLPVKLELALETEFTPMAPGFNVIGEIEGTDLKDEVVMIGAHLDSWHSGTGATDNAAGSAVMMEAMRIIKSLGAKPRRTIRIGLWGGEEQGLIGSRNYVKRTFGERLDKQMPWDSIKLTPAAEKFSVYLNMDNGTGKYRGIYLQQNENARPVFREWLKPFAKMGANTISYANTGGTDHQSFDAIGLPGFQFIQDPIEYSSRTHHTNMDLYDKLIEGDMKHNAVMTAAFAWIAANRDAKFPRKDK